MTWLTRSGLGALLPIATLVSGGTTNDRPRGLYDLAPVSAANPVIARVKECGIEIPVSELLAFAQSEIPPEERGRPRTASQKKALLARLVDEHLLLWDGYQRGGDHSREIAAILKDTEAALLRDELVRIEITSRARTPAEQERRARELQDRIFDTTDIDVAASAYEEMKAVMKALDLASAPPPSSPEEPTRVTEVAPEVRDRVLARCTAATVTTGYVIDVWLRTAMEERPSLAAPEGLAEILKRILGERLLIEEARARGLDASPAVRDTLELNRNVLVRMFAVDRVAEEAARKAKGPGFEARCEQWYEDQRKDRYTYRDESGRERVADFEAEKENIANDLVDFIVEAAQAEHLESLRRGRTIEIDDPLLDRLDLRAEAGAR